MKMDSTYFEIISKSYTVHNTKLSNFNQNYNAFISTTATELRSGLKIRPAMKRIRD